MMINKVRKVKSRLASPGNSLSASDLNRLGEIALFSEIFLRNEIFLENLKQFLSQIDFS
jgi:hypothetical protein